MTSVIGHLRRAALLQDGGGLTDGQLLECFLTRREDAAFEALVRRHGPMVWGVCQRVLRNRHDAEDAFQATFLVLVRKAASIMPRELVGNWLYGVAYRTSMKARTTSARRRAKEKDVPRPEAPADDIWQELIPLLDRELNRLPDKYRVPVVLCELEGRSRREVARQLNLPEGTLSSRLATARKMLAKHLTRYGLTLSTGALAAVLSQNASACVPTSVVSSTIKAATVFAAGHAAATGAIPAQVAALTDGVLKTMLLTKLKISTGVVMLVLAATGGVAGLAYQPQAGGPTKAERVNEPKKDKDNPAVAKNGEKPKEDIEQIQGKWVVVSAEVAGKPHDEIVGDSMIFDKDKCFINHIKRNDTDSGTFQLDSNKKPKQIDATARGDDKVTKGIYELDGDKLKICMSDDHADERPTKFATSPERKMLFLLVLKRAKK